MKLSLIAIICVIATGCASFEIHDVKRATNELKQGNVETGLSSLLYLSERGYIEADVQLADYYSTLSDVESLDRARKLFERLDLSESRINKAYTKWVEKMAAIDTAFIPQAHKLLKQQLSTDDDSKIKLFRFERRYAEQLGKTFDAQSISDFVREHQLKGPSLIKVIDSLDDPNVYFSQVEDACNNVGLESLYYCYRIFVRQAKWHDSQNLEQIANMLVEDFKNKRLSPNQVESLAKMMLTSKIGEPAVTLAYSVYQRSGLDNADFLLSILKYDVKEKRNFELRELELKLKELLDDGFTEAGLILGNLYTYGNRTPKDPWKAEQFFIQSLSLPESEFRLGLLYIGGQLGEQQLQKGVNLLVSAARNGYRQAYSELVSVFLSTPGVKPNPLYAHVFGEVAVKVGARLSENQRNAIEQISLNQEQRKQAKQLIIEELGSAQTRSSVIAGLVKTDTHK